METKDYKEACTTKNRIITICNSLKNEDITKVSDTYLGQALKLICKEDPNFRIALNNLFKAWVQLKQLDNEKTY